MAKLFQETEIKGIILHNRFVRSATWEGMATRQGAVTSRLIETMTRLARGGVGLIISSHTYVRREGQATPRQLGIYKDELIAGLREMTDAVHRAGGRIILQLAHAGTFAAEAEIEGPPVSVSNFDGLADSPRKELTVRDIKELVAAFAEAARRAKSAGFDGVELHAAHGYLLSQFLSPIYNRRQDEYGGSVRNRARICLEITSAIRDLVGREYPVFIKINGRDYAKNGLVLEDSLQVAGRLAGAGIDAIELSGGVLNSLRWSPSRSRINSIEKEAYFREEAQAFKQAIDIPLILVGGIRSFTVAEQLVENGIADYIAMSRPFIREPELINRWKSGDLHPAECTSDNLCFAPGFEGRGVYCVTAEKKLKDVD